MMPSITVKNIPESTYEALKEIAVCHHRSVNSEIIDIIEKATMSRLFNPEQHLALARRTRKKTTKFLLTEQFVNMAKDEGRP